MNNSISRLLDEMEQRNPGISRAMANSLSPDEEEQDSLMSYVMPKGIPEGVVQATRQRPIIEEMQPAQNEGREEVSYSNYMTGPGIKLPKGMPMMGEEPRQETEQEFLVKNGALDIVGHDPHRTAWDRTVKNWDGWFDIMGGEATPENPKFRSVYGKEFDAELQKYQAEELAKRNQGMEKITRLINQYRGSMDQEGNPIPDATEMDVLKTLGIKGLPGIKDSRDYQGGVPDAGMNSFKEQEKERINIQKQAMREGKDQERAKSKWISDNTKKMENAYKGLKGTVEQKIKDWKAKLKEAEKHYYKGEEGWALEVQSYKDSISQMENFRDKFEDYKRYDRDELAQGKPPVNWQKANSWWSKSIIKQGDPRYEPRMQSIRDYLAQNDEKPDRN